MGPDRTKLLQLDVKRLEGTCMKKSTEAKLELTFLGVLLCILSFKSFTRTSSYAYVESLLQRLPPQLSTFWGISGTSLPYIAFSILVLLTAIYIITSDDPYNSRSLFYFALIMFIPTALAFSQLDIAPFSILKVTTDIQIREAIGQGTIIGCGLILCTWYSEYACLMDDLINRGVDDLEKATRLGLVFGFAVILISGLATFSIGLTYIHLFSSITFFTGLHSLYILALLIIMLAFEYTLIWYMAKSSSSLRRAQTASKES
jgi:hypothetical protein